LTTSRSLLNIDTVTWTRTRACVNEPWPLVGYYLVI